MNPATDGSMVPGAAPVSDPPDEPQLVCRQWFEAYGTAVYNYFRFHVPLPDTAEDLTAETFLKLVRAAERFDPSQGSAKAWILTVAHNVLSDWSRRARLRRYVALGSMHDLVYDAPSPEERLLKEEEVGRVLDAVAALASTDRELIGLRYGSGLEIAEMAQILGTGAGTVRTRLWRALDRLRKVLHHE